MGQGDQGCRHQAWTLAAVCGAVLLPKCNERRRRRVYVLIGCNRPDAAGNRMICDIANEDRRSVLVVEDDDILGEAIGLCVEEAGYEVAGVAQSVDAALTTWRHRPVDAALLDINLR